MSKVIVITKVVSGLGGFTESVSVAAVLQLNKPEDPPDVDELLEIEADIYISTRLRQPHENNEVQSVVWETSIHEVFTFD